MKAQELRQAAYDGDLSRVVRLHKEEKALVHEAGPESKRNPLHWAAYKGHDRVISYLLKAGKVLVDATDIDGNTPLNLALSSPEISLRKKFLVCDILLSSAFNADPTLANLHGQTPLSVLLSLRDLVMADANQHYLLKGVNGLVQKMKRRIVENANGAGQLVHVVFDGSLEVPKNLYRLAMPSAGITSLRRG